MPNSNNTPAPYEELKILDGPIYALSAPERNESSECLLEYCNNHGNNGSVPRSGGEEGTSSSFCATNAGADVVHSCGDGAAAPAVAASTSCAPDKPSLLDCFPPHQPSPLPAETTALLIVDVQPEYWSNCPAVRKDFPHFPSNMAKTIDICRKRRAKIIWVRADYRYSHSPWLLQFERMRGPRNLGEVPCDPTSPEFTWEEFATPQGGEVIIAKSSWSSTSNTALMDILRVAGIETVLVCGLITSVCVQHSAFGVFEAGYRTVLVTDACADRGRARHEAALALYGDYMYELVTSEDLESTTTGLIPAEPVWLTLDATTKQVVRANSILKHQHVPSPPVAVMPADEETAKHRQHPTIMAAVSKVPPSMDVDHNITKTKPTLATSSSSSTASTVSTSSDGDEEDEETNHRKHPTTTVTTSTSPPRDTLLVEERRNDLNIIRVL
jgi:nicotinamidase-related amidase